MKRLFLATTILFWLVLTVLWSTARRYPPPSPEAASPPGKPETRNINLDEVAQHNHAGDCWMAIDGQVYDLTGYLPQHPTRPDVLLHWCGKEATEAWNTKGRGRPHSNYAGTLLQRFRIGDLATPAEK